MRIREIIGFAEAQEVAITVGGDRAVPVPPPSADRIGFLQTMYGVHSDDPHGALAAERKRLDNELLRAEIEVKRAEALKKRTEARRNATTARSATSASADRRDR